MHAVILTGGKQYRVQEGDVLSIEKLPASAGQTVGFDQVLLLEDGDSVRIGTPVVENAVVRAEVLETYKDDKVLVFKKKRRKQYRRTRGHRQQLTRIRVDRIVPDVRTAAEEPARPAAPAKPAEAAAAPPKAAPKAAAPRAPKAPAPKAPAKAAPKAKKAAAPKEK